MRRPNRRQLTRLADAGLGDVQLLAPGLAVLALLGWIAAAYGAGAALLRHRDLK